MFWKNNFSCSTQIDELLEKEDVTLLELMDEEEMLQECKAQNRKLIDFLTRPQVLYEMVGLVVTEPSEDADMKSRFKYANLAAEVLTCGDSTIFETLADSQNLLLTLYMFLENEPPLNPLLASFFSKVLGMLVIRRAEQNWYSYQFICFRVMDFLKSKGNFVELVVRHVGTSAIMDLLNKLICGVEDNEMKQGINKWLCECGLVEQLIDKLSSQGQPDDQSSIDQLLCDIVINSRCDSNGDNQCSPNTHANNSLVNVIESEEIVNKLLDALLPEDCTDSTVCHVVNILITLLSTHTSRQFRPDQSSIVESNNSLSHIYDTRINVAKIIIRRLPDLQSILLRPSKKRLLTAYGCEMEPLGITRLQIIQLMTALVATNDYTVHCALAKLNTLQHILDMFFKFSLNNFLHTRVMQCLYVLLTDVPSARNGDPVDHPLLTQVIAQCQLIERIMKAYKPTQTEECSSHNLCGYMGHLNTITNTLVKQQIESGINNNRIQTLINSLPPDTVIAWNKFTSEDLIEINSKNEIPALPGFKEMDMDVMGDVRYAENEFKDTEEYLSGSLHRLTTQMGLNAAGLSASGAPQETASNCDENNYLFDKLCSERKSDLEMFNNLWDDKEKTITFTDTQDEEEQRNQNTPNDERHSSSDEDDFDDQFDALRHNSEEKMEVDPSDEWSSSFDKKDENSADPGGAFNPWQSAQAEDISSDNSWANFGSNAFSSPSTNPFSSPPSQSETTIFSNPSSDLFPGSIIPIQPKTSEFDADFDGAFTSPTDFVITTSKDKSKSPQSSLSPPVVINDKEEHLKLQVSQTDTITPVNTLKNLQKDQLPLQCNDDDDGDDGDDDDDDDDVTTTPPTINPKDAVVSKTPDQDNLEDNFMFLSTRGLIKPPSDIKETSTPPLPPTVPPCTESS